MDLGRATVSVNRSPPGANSCCYGLGAVFIDAAITGYLLAPNLKTVAAPGELFASSAGKMCLRRDGLGDHLRRILVSKSHKGGFRRLRYRSPVPKRHTLAPEADHL